MNAIDVCALGHKYKAEGKLDMAVDLYKQAAQMPNPFGFAPAWAFVYEVMIGRGDKAGAREALINFLNAPQNGFTLDALPKFKLDLANLERELNPQPQPQQAPK